MSLEVFVLVIAIHAIALVSPGPDFAVVTRWSIVSGRRAGMWAATGVAASIGIYVLVCLLGLSLVLAALPGLSRFLSIAGALYLAWLGIQCLRCQISDFGSNNRKSPARFASPGCLNIGI